jgi:ketosteroid isomerase-like protein
MLRSAEAFVSAESEGGVMSIETVRRIYDAFARGDLDAVIDECAADVVVNADWYIDSQAVRRAIEQ